MVWIPFLVSSAVAILFPSYSVDGSKRGANRPNSSRSLCKTGAQVERNLPICQNGTITIFALGLVAGTGIGVYMTSIIRHHRVRERLRRLYRNWVIREAIRNAIGDDDGLDDNVQNQNKLLKVETSNIQILRSDNDDHTTSSSLSFPQHGRKRIREFFDASGSGSTVQLLASPDTFLTTSMNASLLTITPFTKTRPRTAEGAELYIVVQGEGEFTIGGEEMSHEISTKDIVVINPWSVRSIENVGRANLILVRVTDEEQRNDKDFDEGFHSSSNVVSTNEAVTKALTSIVNSGVTAFDALFHGTPPQSPSNSNKCMKDSSPRSVATPGFEI